MKYTKLLMMAFYISSTAAFLPLQADDEGEADCVETRGSLTQEDIQQAKEICLSEGEECEKASNDAGNSTHIASDHKLKKFTNNWDIELEDGSTWQIMPSDLEKVKGWAFNHTILVMQSGSYGPYHYALFNESLGGQCVRAEILDACLVNSRFAFRIEDIWSDYRGQFWLKLSDGSKWVLYNSEMSIWRDWQRGDFVFIGDNNIPHCISWLYAPNILINFCSPKRDYIQSQCKSSF